MRGFTLPEVLVSAVILSFLVVGTYNILIVGNLMYYNEMGLLELRQNARQAMEVMINGLRESSDIQITSLDSNNDMIIFNNYKGTGIRYYRDIEDNNSDGRTDQIIQEYPIDSWKVLANNVTTLRFSHSSPYLTIEIRTEKTVGQKPFSFSLKEYILLRNE